MKTSYMCKDKKKKKKNQQQNNNKKNKQTNKQKQNKKKPQNKTETPFYKKFSLRNNHSCLTGQVK